MFRPGPDMSSFNTSFDDNAFGMDGTADTHMHSIDAMMMTNSTMPGHMHTPMPRPLQQVPSHHMSFGQPGAMGMNGAHFFPNGNGNDNVMSTPNTNPSLAMSPNTSFLHTTAGMNTMRISPQPSPIPTKPKKGKHVSGSTPYKNSIATKSVTAYRSDADRAIAQGKSSEKHASPGSRASTYSPAPAASGKHAGPNAGSSTVSGNGNGVSIHNEASGVQTNVPTIASSRPKRQASTKAASVFSEFVKIEKEMAREDGERSSEEDSAESQFEASDEDFA